MNKNLFDYAEITVYIGVVKIYNCFCVCVCVCVCVCARAHMYMQNKMESCIIVCCTSSIL